MFLRRDEGESDFTPESPSHASVPAPLAMPVSYPRFNPWAVLGPTAPARDSALEDLPAHPRLVRHRDLASFAVTCRAALGPVGRVLYSNVFEHPSLFHALESRPFLREAVKTLHLQGYNGFEGLRLSDVFPNLEAIEVSQPWELAWAEPRFSLAVHMLLQPHDHSFLDFFPERYPAIDPRALTSLHFQADCQETFKTYADIVRHCGATSLSVACRRYSPMTLWLLALGTCGKSIKHLSIDGPAYEYTPETEELLFNYDVEALQKAGVAESLETIRLRRLPLFAQFEDPPAELALEFFKRLQKVHTIWVQGPTELCPDSFVYLPPRLEKIIFDLAGHYHGFQAQHRRLIHHPPKPHYIADFYPMLAACIAQGVQAGAPISHVVLRGPRKRWSLATPILANPCRLAGVAVAVAYTAETELGAQAEVHCHPSKTTITTPGLYFPQPLPRALDKHRSLDSLDSPT